MSLMTNTQKQNMLNGCVEFYMAANMRMLMLSKLSVSAALGYSACAEIQDCSVINGRGRAPLIVVPDTGTRPQTKQDRAGAGCHAQSPSSRKPECCSGGFGEVTGYLVMTVEGSSEGTRVSNQLWEVWGMFQAWPYSWDGDFETNRN